jgi:uncharacterized protein involved in exopolysaccharide biosynthesis
MNPPDLALARISHADPEVHLGRLYQPFLRRWRVVAACLAAAWAAALALVLLPPREYRAQLVLAAVPSAKAASLAGGLSSLLGNAQLGGVQSTPFFITRLLMLRGVLNTVAYAKAGRGSEQVVIERVLDLPASEIEPEEVEPAMRDLLAAEVDKQTGLVTFSVTHADSALSRYVAEQLVRVARESFVNVVRAQATDLRVAGEVNVDSVRRQLRRAEQALQDFQTSHRVYATYSEAAVTRQRLEREVTNAQAAYTQAMSDRANAIARELEETPSVVVVDPIPAELMPVSRQAVLKLLLASMLALAVSALVLAARGEFAAPDVRRAEGVRSAA